MRIGWFSVLLLVQKIVEMITVQKILSKEGDTIMLNCSGSYTTGTWRGPDQGRPQIPYFDGLDFNPNIRVSNIGVVFNTGSEHYDLIIYNASEANVGLYTCEMKEKALGTFRIQTFRLMVENISDEDTTNVYVNKQSSTGQFYIDPVDGHKCDVKVNKEDIQPWIISCGILGGLIILLIGSHILCYLNRSRHTQEIHPIIDQIQYDEIGTISYNMVNLQALISNTETEDAQMNRGSVTTSQSSVTMVDENEYGNDFQALDDERIHEQRCDECGLSAFTLPTTELEQGDELFSIETIANSASHFATLSTDEEISDSSRESDTICLACHENSYQTLSTENLDQHTYSIMNPKP